MNMISIFTPLADIIDTEIQFPSASESLFNSGAIVFFGLAALLIAATVVLVIVNIVKNNKK